MDDENLMMVWILKWALTKGPLLVEADVDGEESKYRYAHVRDTKNPAYGLHRIGKDAFLTKREAFNRLQKLKARKLDSLERQLVKIKSIRFPEEEQ
jgi:hypothetical protein